MNGAAMNHLWIAVAVWGLIATGLMTIILEGAQMFGISRLSLPFLFGTFFTGNRSHAQIIGYVVYSIGGFVFAFVYVGAFLTVGHASWWFGTLMGFLHGLFLITVMLPLMPYVHPRMATDHDGPTARQRLEPPGVFGANYGRLTPITTVFGQTLFGLVLGWVFSA